MRTVRAVTAGPEGDRIVVLTELLHQRISRGHLGRMTVQGPRSDRLVDSRPHDTCHLIEELCHVTKV